MITSRPCPPSCHFITLRLADRHADLLVSEVGALRQAMRDTMARLPFKVDAAVVLPATLHMIWSLPDPAEDPGKRIAMLKRRFVRHRKVEKTAEAVPSPWHRDHWVCALETALDHARHRHLIHHAPVAASLVSRPRDWLLSSIHRDLRDRRTAPHADSGVPSRLAAPTGAVA
jgi:putative transposase